MLGAAKVQIVDVLFEDAIELHVEHGCIGHAHIWIASVRPLLLLLVLVGDLDLIGGEIDLHAVVRVAAPHDEQLEDELDELDEAEHTHAEEQVQMTAKHTEQVLPRNFGLLVYLHVGERVVCDRELDHIRAQVDHVVVLVVVRLTHARTPLVAQARDVQSRRRMMKMRHVYVDHSARTLEWTARHTVGRYVAVAQERVVKEVARASQLLLAQTIVDHTHRVVHPYKQLKNKHTFKIYSVT